MTIFDIFTKCANIDPCDHFQIEFPKAGHTYNYRFFMDIPSRLCFVPVARFVIVPESYTVIVTMEEP